MPEPPFHRCDSVSHGMGRDRFTVGVGANFVPMGDRQTGHYRGDRVPCGNNHVRHVLRVATRDSRISADTTGAGALDNRFYTYYAPPGGCHRRLPVQSRLLVLRGAVGAFRPLRRRRKGPSRYFVTRYRALMALFVYPPSRLLDILIQITIASRVRLDTVSIITAAGSA